MISDTSCEVFPVMGGTLFLAPGQPSWQIGWLQKNEIVWGAIPATGLPALTAWDSVVGRYPDALWVRSPSGTGGLDWYRWSPARRSWNLDAARVQGRRADAMVLPWISGRLVAIELLPYKTNVSHQIRALDSLTPAPPQLARPDATLIQTAPTGDFVAVYTDPAELWITVADGKHPRRVPIPSAYGNAFTSLIVRSTSDIVLTGDFGSLVSAVRFDGTVWTALPHPLGVTLPKYVETSDGTLWISDGSSVVWKRALGGPWTSVALPGGTTGGELRCSPVDDHMWIRLSDGSTERWASIGDVREKNHPVP